MMSSPEILHFPSNIVALPQSKVVSVAIESSGHVESDDPLVMRLDHTRRIFLLLANKNEIDPEADGHSVDISWARVNERAFSVAEEPQQYAEIGYWVAWMPVVRLMGKLFVDDIKQLPWRDIFEDERLPAKAAVVVGTLGRNSKIHLPETINRLIPDHPYYIHGESIRTTSEFPDPPGGGTRQVA